MMLGDVGGLYGLLVSISVTILAIFNFQKPETHLAGSLYKDRDEEIRADSQNSLKEYFMSYYPCSKMERSRRDLAFE